MTIRDDAINAGTRALIGGLPDEPEWSCVVLSRAVVDAVTPIIEADVESHNRCHCTSCIVSEECLAEGCQFDRSMADLRERIAQEIEAGCVHGRLVTADMQGVMVESMHQVCYRCQHAARIALLGGESDNVSMS